MKSSGLDALLRILVVLLPLLMGCAAHHVTFVGPPPNASPAQREAAFVRLRPVEPGEVATITMRGSTAHATFVTPYLRLRDGTIVEEPDDVLGLVAPDSDTAFFANRYVRHRMRTRRARLVTAAFFAAAGAFAVSATVAGFRDSDSVLPLTATTLGFGLGGLFSAAPAVRYRSQSRAARRLAFRNYERDLARNLGYCEDVNGVLHACDPEPPTSMPTPTPTWE